MFMIKNLLVNKLQISQIAQMDGWKVCGFSFIVVRPAHGELL